MSIDIHDEILDATEAGRLLKIHPKTVKRLAAKGVLPGKRIGSVWRFKKSTLDVWFDEDLDFSRHARSQVRGDNL